MDSLNFRELENFLQSFPLKQHKMNFWIFLLAGRCFCIE